MSDTPARVRSPHPDDLDLRLLWKNNTGSCVVKYDEACDLTTVFILDPDANKTLNRTNYHGNIGQLHTLKGVEIPSLTRLILALDTLGRLSSPTPAWWYRNPANMDKLRKRIDAVVRDIDERNDPAIPIHFRLFFRWVYQYTHCPQCFEWFRRRQTHVTCVYSLMNHSRFQAHVTMVLLSYARMPRYIPDELRRRLFDMLHKKPCLIDEDEFWSSFD